MNAEEIKILLEEILRHKDKPAGVGLDGWDWAFVEHVDKHHRKRPLTEAAGRRLQRIWMMLQG